MGMNYYHRINICDHCNRYDEKHIGKSSAGWEFSFQGYTPEDNRPVILSFKDWKRELKNTGKIFDEDGEEISYEKFVELIESKKNGTFNDNPNKNHYDYCMAEANIRGYDMSNDWKDEEGHSFASSDFF